MDETKGLNIVGKKFTNLRFADDKVLFAESEKGLQKQLNTSCHKTRKVGLELNKQGPVKEKWKEQY